MAGLRAWGWGDGNLLFHVLSGPGPITFFSHLHVSVQLFRADLISAMKLPDSMPLESGSFLTIKEPWRTEWEVGVQVSGSGHTQWEGLVCW